VDWNLVAVIAGSAIWTTIELYLVTMNLYLFGISLAGLRRRKEEKSLVPVKSFAVVIPAHDEEQVIAQTVASVLAVDYPRELFEVFVVADNCADATAERAREAGATVLVREDRFLRGKNEAVRFGMDRVLADARDFDAVVVVDADNVVSKNILLEFSNRLVKGERVVQAYLDTKNPNDTWITWMYAISYWITARYIQLAPSQLGLPCQLGGTGYCIEADTLRRYGWDVTALTDDLEYTMKLVLAGINPTWAHDAVIYDEKPLTMRSSLRQRLRWMQGHWDVAARYAGPLFRRAWRDKSPSAFHAALYCLAPTRIVLWGVTIAFAWVPIFVPQAIGLAIHPWSGLAIGLAVLAFFFAYPLVLLALERVPWHYYVKYLLMFVFGPTWVVAASLGFLRRKQKHWDKTQHTRALSIEEVEAIRGRAETKAKAKAAA
jgi:cellulose synthase/poly-beta-1,6-N-acetylglucosamine synthase-like glycosyltransferase